MKYGASIFLLDDLAIQKHYFHKKDHIPFYNNQTTEIQ